MLTLTHAPCIEMAKDDRQNGSLFIELNTSKLHDNYEFNLTLRTLRFTTGMKMTTISDKVRESSLRKINSNGEHKLTKQG